MFILAEQFQIQQTLPASQAFLLQFQHRLDFLCVKTWLAWKGSARHLNY